MVGRVRDRLISKYDLLSSKDVLQDSNVKFRWEILPGRHLVSCYETVGNERRALQLTWTSRALLS